MALTEMGLADANVFDANNTNVDYLGMNYGHFLGDFDDPGTLPVDLQYGVVPSTPLVSDPNGVNDILVELGFPDDPTEVRGYDDQEYNGSGIVSAAVFAWLATDGESNLDPRHLIDENRQLVEYYVEDLVFPAGNTWDEPLLENLRENPRWQVPEPSSLVIVGWAALGLVATSGLRKRNSAMSQ